METKPMMELEQNPQGVPILSYNVPEPTSYSMNHIIRVDLSEFGKGSDLKDVFVESAFESKREDNHNGSGENSNDTNSASNSFEEAIAEIVERGEQMPELGQRSIGGIYGRPYYTESINKFINRLDFKELEKIHLKYKNAPTMPQLRLGQISNQPRLISVPRKPKIEPQLLILEKYKLSTFCGAYGAGKTINTFSLLPGEKTKLSVKTYLRTEETRKEAASILDSYTDENAEEFEDSIISEDNSKTNSEVHGELSAEIEGEYNSGVARVKGKVNAKGGTSSSREEFAKNVQNATSKNANKASTKRESQINTSSESSISSGQESDIVREIENINVSRTVNFIFRQMNQEYITILHMTDIRVGFFNGESGSVDIYTLPELDDLLEKYILLDKREVVRKYISNEISSILDYNDSIPQPIDRPAMYCRSFS
ncbi:hypothetical protein [Foetidibacter luteolus]|uniref:hypothetical protein n=1 Tax=Foetidibacter luteolus TaxID=2608880 RepID=UPI00129A73CC|nr:hypothetical protein [Foetidibacter luteolus]